MPLKTPQLTKFTTAGPIAVNFDYQDIAEGTGKVIYFGGTTRDDAALAYNLFPNALYSSEISTDAAGSGTVTANFDLSPFNIALTAKGTAFLSAGLVAGAGGTIKLLAQVKKWDGSSETNISSEITTETISAAQEMVAIPIPLTQHDFKIGDILRLTVKITVTTGGNLCKLGHDPKGRTLDAVASSVMEFHMSYRIDQ